jgi:hypothetical protein
MNHSFSINVSGKLIYTLLITAISISISTSAPSIGSELVDTTHGAPATTASTASEGAVPATTTTLKGNVVEVGVTLNNLRDARLSISRVRKAAANLYDEVTRQQVTMNFNPNVVGTTVIMTPTPSFTGVYLPARQKWVAESMAEIGPIIGLFKEDVDAAIESNRQTDVSDSTKEALSPLRTDAFEAVNSSAAIYKQLEGLTAGFNYNNAAIASDVKALDKQLKTLDKSLKKGIGILQKEAKSAKKRK